MNWWQILIVIYVSYLVVIVVDLYWDRETRPHDGGTHALVWGIALAWPAVFVYYLVSRVRRRLAIRRLIRRSSFGQAFEEGARTKRSEVRRAAALARERAQLPPFSRHPDAAYGGQERIRICLDPECHCRDHRDVDPDHYPIRNPEDHWR